MCKSKTDQEGAGQEVAIPHGAQLRPMEAVRAWLHAAGIASGPVFRRVRKNGRVGDDALSAEALVQVVKHYVGRAGFLTIGAESGASIFKLMDVSRHELMDTLRGYVRRAELFNGHAGSGFL